MTTEGEEQNKVTLTISQLIAWKEFPGFSTERGNPGESWKSLGIEEMTQLGSQVSQSSQDRIPERTECSKISLRAATYSKVMIVNNTTLYIGKLL